MTTPEVAAVETVAAHWITIEGAAYGVAAYRCACGEAFGFPDSASAHVAREVVAALDLPARDRRAKAEVQAQVHELQEHIAYHLRDFAPRKDDAVSGDLAVDMAARADRWKARAEAAEVKLARTQDAEQIETIMRVLDSWGIRKQIEDIADDLATALDLPAVVRRAKAEALREFGDKLPQLTEGTSRVGTLGWPEPERDAYSIAIEEASGAARAEANRIEADNE